MESHAFALKPDSDMFGLFRNEDQRRLQQRSLQADEAKSRTVVRTYLVNELSREARVVSSTHTRLRGCRVESCGKGRS